MKKGEKWVVDTNVPIAANGGTTDSADRKPAKACRLAAVEFLEELLEKGKVLLDRCGDIQEEYLRHLDPQGQPGVGDQFLLQVLNSHPDRIERINLPRNDDGEFEHVPRQLIEQGFDRNDRKFVALAVRGAASIANATDSDWLNATAVLHQNHVIVENICGCDREEWFEG